MGDQRVPYIDAIKMRDARWGAMIPGDETWSRQRLEDGYFDACYDRHVLLDALHAAEAREARMRQALENIAEDDDLVVASGGAWGQQAYERRRDIARVALAELTKEKK